MTVVKYEGGLSEFYFQQCSVSGVDNVAPPHGVWRQRAWSQCPHFERVVRHEDLWVVLGAVAALGEAFFLTWLTYHLPVFCRTALLAQFTKLDDAVTGYISYGAGDFDGQNSGHDFYGVSAPPKS